MYYIYALKCEELVLYVGQTINMRLRFNTHRSKANKCGSSEIPADIDYYMDLLEIIDTKEEAIQKEQFYYDTLKPFYNKFRPGQTDKESAKEWQKRNKKYQKEWRKEYYRERKEYYREIYLSKKKNKF